MIILSINGIKIPVEIFEGELKLDAFQEPTISMLQLAFENGDYIVEEPLHTDKLPDWNNFIREMDDQGLFMVGLTANFAVFTQIFNMLLALRDRHSLANDDSIEWRNFKLMYTLGRAAFTDAQLARVEAAMLLANIPLIE